MAGQTQKQIAEKYKGNLDYFRKGHYLRRLRGIAFLLAVAGSIAAVLGFRFWGTEEFFSTGAISENHARFANDCQVCHEGADPDVLKLLPIDAARQLSIEKVRTAAGDVKLPSMDAVKTSAEKTAASVRRDLSKDNLQALAEKGLAFTSLSLMDRACLKCHEPMGLHQPQTAPLALRGVSNALPLVHADSCSLCHREHVGHQRMKLPTSETCESCHNNPAELARTRDLLKLDLTKPPTRGENRNIGDGLVRFLAPPRREPLPPFESYAKGHPPFAYEQANLRDPAVVNYNHARHEQADVRLRGRKLVCADCHQPGGGGVFYQRIDYEKHCVTCHSLQLNGKSVTIRIPHGDPEKVRDFVRPDSLTLQFAEALRGQGLLDRVELARKVKEEFDELTGRGISTGEELQERVFFKGDPPITQVRITPKSNTGQAVTACAKCHETKRAGGLTAVPKITPTNMAERWVHRGPFTHVPHAHMACTDCHGAATTSKLTSDILMPPQQLCAECHRPLEREKLAEAEDALKLRAELKPGSTELADAQRHAGGAKSDCQSCHVFHAPPTATLLLEAHRKK